MQATRKTGRNRNGNKSGASRLKSWRSWLSAWATFGMSFTMPAMTAAVMEAAPRQRTGITLAVFNASRQAGGVQNVVLLGAFVGRHGAFVPGLHLAVLVAGATFLAGCAL